jgi:hypothetical protein
VLKVALNKSKGTPLPEEWGTSSGEIFVGSTSSLTEIDVCPLAELPPGTVRIVEVKPLLSIGRLQLRRRALRARGQVLARRRALSARVTSTAASGSSSARVTARASTSRRAGR